MEEKKKLNLFDVFNLGIGGAIGSGIFVMMGLGIMYTGRSILLDCSRPSLSCLSPAKVLLGPPAP